MYSTFKDHTKLFERLNQSKKDSELEPKPKMDSVDTAEPMKRESIDESIEIPIMDALFMGLKLKEKIVENRTCKDYKNNIELFLNWLAKTYPNTTNLNDLKKVDFIGFLNSILEKSSARNRNNY